MTTVLPPNAKRAFRLADLRPAARQRDVKLRDMSPANRREWLRRQLVLAERYRVELESDPDMRPGPVNNPHATGRPRIPGLAERILAVLRASTRVLSAPEIAQLAGCGRSSVHDRARQLVRDGKVRQVLKGRWQAV